MASLQRTGPSGWRTAADSPSRVTRLQVSDDGTVTKKQNIVIPPQGSAKPEDLALGGPWVWITTNTSGVARIHRESNELGAQILPIGKTTVGVLASEDGINVSDRDLGTITKLSPTTGDEVWVSDPVGEFPCGLALADDSLWVANSGDNTVSEIDAGNGDILRRGIGVGINPRDVAYAAGFIWVANTGPGTVTKIDASTGEVADAIPVGNEPANILAGAGSIWVSNSKSGTLSRIEP